MHSLKKYRTHIIVLLLIVIIAMVLRHTLLQSITFSPVREAELQLNYEKYKDGKVLSEFETDGCSGNLSLMWTEAVRTLSEVSSSFEERYKDREVLMFEDACVKHDKAYHKGDGGYVARLVADNQLRRDIITYAIENTWEIKKRTGIETDEAAIFLYETIADVVYRGVRLGGGPCTGKPYAWGYGYGECEMAP